MAKTKKELEKENANLRQKVLDLENEVFNFKSNNADNENLPDFTVGVFKIDKKFHLALIKFNGITETAKIIETKPVKLANGESMAIAEREREKEMIEYQIRMRE